MTYFVGFLIWFGIALVAGLSMYAVFHEAETNRVLTVIFAIFGAFIGGMLGVSGYIWHAPTPLRAGAVIGAIAGSCFFSFVYQFTARKAL